MFFLKSVFLAASSIVLLPSYTNQSYLIDETCVVRIAGDETDRYIDRQSEYHNAIEAFKHGFNPAEILYCNPKTGMMITSFVLKDGNSPKWEEFHNLDIIQSMGKLLKEIHTSGMDFQNDQDVFKRLNAFVKYLPQEALKLKEKVQEISLLLQYEKACKVPCHNDVLPDNVLKKGDKFFLIDWEHSGNNHPAWDFAHLSCLMQYKEEEERALIRAYNAAHPEFMYQTMVLFKAVSEFWIAAWAYSQAPKYSEYAANHLKRCQDHINSLEFQRAKEYVYRNIQDQTGSF